MARPKEKTSTAFQQKCSAASDKLRKFQAEKLRSDMERLFSEEILTDLTVQLLGSSVSLHSCVLRARSTSLYDHMMSLSAGANCDKHVSLTEYGRASELCEIFKALYIEDDIIPHLRKFEAILKEPCTADRLSSNTVIGTRENCLENSDTMVNETPGNATDRLSLNGICGPELNDEEYRNIAEKIVQSSFKEAKLVIKRESKTGQLYQNGNGDTESNMEMEKKRNVADTNGVEENIGKDNEITLEDIEDNIANVEDRKASGEETEEVRVCRANSEDERESVQALAERIWGTKMKFEPCGVLGSDLLRMLLEGENCDYNVLVQDRNFQVHSCVLAARSLYFEAMLGGGWRESEAQQTELEGVSPSAVRQMLLYLYGGVIEVETSCSLGSLVVLSDMYGMEGLKEVVAFNLNKEFCHFFHRPCAGCISGVPDTLALTLMYNMDVMKDKCVKWINKNFDKVWPTKTFALLPQEVLEFCVSSAVKDLALDNVIDVMVECRKLNETTPRLRWSEPIFDIITQLMDSAIEYASQNFVPLVSSKTFRKLNQQGIAFNRQPLEDIFGMVIMALSPENACQSYLSLNKWVVMMQPKDDSEEFSLYSQEFLEFVECLFKKCKEHLCTYIHQAANTVEWSLLTKDMQEDLMKEANYVCIDDPNKCRVARPKLTSMQKKISTTSPLSLKEYFDRHFGSKEHLQTITKGSTATNKGLPKSAKGRSPTPSKEDSSKLRKEETEKRTASSSKVKKQDQEQTKTAPPVTKSGLSMMKTNKSGARSVQSKLLASKGEEKGRATSSTNTKKETKVQTRQTNRSTNDEIHDEKSESNVCDMGDQPRARSSSAGAATFRPQFGQRDGLKSAQSMESFFDSRQGQTTYLQRPVPTLEVNFIVPCEFFEAF